MKDRTERVVEAFPRVAAAVYFEPWLITPEMHGTIRALLEARVERGAATGTAWQAREVLQDDDDDGGGGAAVTRLAPGVAGVEMRGVIGKRLGFFEKMCGGCDVDDVRAALDEAAAMEDVNTVVLLVDSPGGTATGVPELGERVRELGETKRVVAYCETVMASAAYWIGGQATDVVSTRSAAVGSIGVYLAFLDETEALAAEGLRLELFRAGRLKAAGMRGKEMEAHEREYFQERVDALWAEFKAAVEHRNLEDETMQGQTFDGREAAERNLVDFTVRDLPELLELLAAAEGAGTAAAS